MKTVTVDDSKRIRIPEAKPRQVFAYESDGNRITLTLVEPVRPQAKVVKHGGRKYLTSERPVSNADTEAVMANFP